MKLDKTDALLLVKLITIAAAHTELDECVTDLEARLDDFILNGNEDQDECEDEDCCDSSDHCEEDDEESEEDEGDAEEASGEEDEEESGEEEDEEDPKDSDDDESDKEELETDGDVDAADLHELKPVKAVVVSSSQGDVDDEVTIEFEETETLDGTQCDLIVNGGQIVGPVTHVRRKADELHVAVGDSKNREWHRFSVSRFPKGWSDVLHLEELVEVV